MSKCWNSKDLQEIAKRLKWPQSLIPNIPAEIKKVYGFNPPIGAILRDINGGQLVRDTDEKTGILVMRRVQMTEEPKFALGQTVWYISDEHVVRKFRVLDIRQFITKYVYKPPVFRRDHEIINSYRLETERFGVYDRGNHIWEDSLYKDELHARIQADDDLRAAISELESKLEVLRKRHAANVRRLKKLEKENAGT